MDREDQIIELLTEIRDTQREIRDASRKTAERLTFSQLLSLLIWGFVIAIVIALVGLGIYQAIWG